MYQKILLPTDGSENAKRAGKHAIWIADFASADIIVLNVVDIYYPQMAALPNFRETLYDDLMEEGRRAVEDFKDDLKENQCQGTCKNVNLTTAIREGKPYKEILEIISKEDVDLVVMGASGRHGLDRYLLGSVTERVLREAKCPVLVVP
jgi:nucleotide-binding universal stress UspA family protein